MGTGPEHYLEAERLLGEIGQAYADSEAKKTRLTIASQAHATLALAAATALAEGGMMPGADFDAWRDAAGAPDAGVA